MSEADRWTIDAVPSPTMWYCSHCGVPSSFIELRLGGWAMVRCPVWEKTVVGTPKQPTFDQMTLHPGEKVAKK